MKSKLRTFKKPEILDRDNCLLSYWDKNLVCRFANNQFTSWFGKNPKELIGRVTFQMLLADKYFIFAPYIKNVFDGQVQLHRFDWKIITGELRSVVGTYYPDKENGDVSGFFLHISFLQQDRHSEITEGHDLNTLNSNTINKVAEFLETQVFVGFPKTERLAQLHCISVSKLMRDFKATFNTSPFSYFRKLQMEFANQYIKETGCTKKQISLMLGFSNPANFTVCYNRWQKASNDFDNSTDIKDNFVNENWIFGQLPVAVAMLDTNLKYINVSEQWNLDFNLQPGEVLNRSIYDFFPTQKLKWQKHFEQVLGERLTINTDSIVNLRGVSIRLHCKFTPWADTNSKLGGIIIYVKKFDAQLIEHKQHFFERLQV